MNMQNLADAMGTGAVAVVKGYGLSIRDVGAALAVLGDNNIRGAQAGTQLRMAVQSLAVPAKTGKAALAELGLQSDTLAKDMQHGGLLEAMTDLHNHIKTAGLTAQQQGQVLTEAFGKKAGVGVNILVDQFDRLQSKYPELDKGAHEFGNSWDTTTKTTKQKIADLKGSFDGLLIKIGQSTRGAQGSLADIGSKAFGKISGGIDAVRAANQSRTAAKPGDSGSAGLGHLANALNDIYRIGSAGKKILESFGPGLAQIGKAAGGATGIALHGLADTMGLLSRHATLVRTLAYQVAAGFLIWKTAAFASAIATRALALAAALLEANPVVLIAIAVAALAIGLFEAYKHVGWFRDAVNAAGRALKEAGKWVVDFAKAVGRDAVKAFDAVVDAGKKVGGFAKDVGRWFADAFRSVEDATKAVGRWFQRMWDDSVKIVKGFARAVGDAFMDVYHAISRVVTGVLDFVGRHWRLLLVIFTGPVGLIIVIIVNMKDRIINGFRVMWDAVTGFVARLWHDVAGFFTSLWHDVSDIASRLWHDVAGFFTRLWSDVSGFASRIWHDVAGFFSNMWRDVSGFASRIWHDVTGFFGNLWHDVSGFTSRLWHDVAGFFSNIWKDVTGFASKIWHDVAGFFTSLWHDVAGFMSNLWHDVAGFFSNIWRDVTGFASRIWHDVASFFGNMWHDVEKTVSNLWHDVTGWFERVKNDVTNSVKTAVGWVKNAWDGLREIFKAPINFMINTVYNGGIVPVWNFLADIVHEGHLQKAQGLQHGGRLPGYGGGDIIPAMLEPGEAVVPKHLVPEMAPWAKKKGIPGFALGGIVGDVANAVTHPIDTLESLGSGTLNILGSAVHWVRGQLAKAVEAMLTPVKGAINGTLGTTRDWKGLAGRLMLKPLDKIVDVARGQDDKDQAAAAAAAAAAPVGAAPAGDIQAYAMQLLTARGWAGMWNSFNALVMGESGWNPAATNPSSGAYGIAQALPPSKYDSYGNRNDYHVQLRWMLDYIAGRYGTPANAYSTWLSRSPHWYDQGGPLKPGLTLAANGTGVDEWVVPKSAVSVTTSAGRQPITLTVNVDARGASDPAAVDRAIRRAGADLVATLDQMLQQGVGDI